MTPSQWWDICKDLENILWPQNWRVRVQDRGDHAILGEQQQRQGEGHPQQQGVWAGRPPGDLHVSRLGWQYDDDTSLSDDVAVPWHSAAPGTAPVSRSTSGTACWPMTPTMTVPASSWTGSSSPPAVSAGNTWFIRISNFLVIFFADATKTPFSDKQSDTQV